MRRGTVSYLTDMNEAVTALRTVFYVRWMRKAQKQALTEWRDREQTPGVMARFNESAYKDYGFTDRNPFYWRKRGPNMKFRPYFYSGAFRWQLRHRKAKAVTKNSQSVVRTRFKYGGGVLNLLQNKHGTVDTYRSRTAKQVFVQPYEYSHRRTGTTVRVHGYVATRYRTRYHFVKAGKSYAQEWGARYELKDRPWLERRTAALFVEQFRRTALTKRGAAWRRRYFGRDE